MKTINYRSALGLALGLHIVLAFFLLFEHHSEQFVVKSAPRNEFSQNMELDRPETQTIQAVSVDSQELAETMNRLKTERAQKQQAELNHQREVAHQLQVAQQQRLREQQNLERMKKEAARLALEQKKQVAAEKQHLKELTEKKAIQERQLAELTQKQLEMQKQQQQEKVRLAEVQKQKNLQDAREKEQAALKEKNRLAEKAALEQQRAAQMSGEVNKYKALIIQAISQHWILPEHVNHQLYSQFRIRLAPNGTVLNVSLIRSSGDPILDRSAQAAIYKASPLPVPSDQEMFNLFRDISLTVRPESARG